MEVFYDFLTQSISEIDFTVVGTLHKVGESKHGVVETVDHF